jgi:hypothetical protein
VKELTPKQRELLRYILTHRSDNHGSAPTLREMASGIGVFGDKSVLRMLKKLSIKITWCGEAHENRGQFFSPTKLWSLSTLQYFK